MRRLWRWLKQAGAWIKQQGNRYKPYIYALILAAILAFFSETLYRNWQEISAVEIKRSGWALLVLATGINLLAHIWTGWVWGWILQTLGQPISNIWSVQVYLKTNIAKYLPTNLVHLYGRTIAAKSVGVPLGVASLSVLLDTLMMVAGGLILGLLSLPEGGEIAAGVGLVAILFVIHPSILQWLIRLVAALFNHQPNGTKPKLMITHYPWRSLFGELVFVGLRGIGFIVTLLALMPVPLKAYPHVVSIYSIGWLLGFITPGAPAGIGVFELTVSSLLSHQGLLSGEESVSLGLAIAAVGLSRLSSVFAEALGAGLAWLDEKLPDQLGWYQSSALPVGRPLQVPRQFKDRR